MSVLLGNCLDVLPMIGERPRLIFADPPYNQGVNYGNGKAADRLPRDEYRLVWVGRWVSACADALAADGSLGTSTMGPGVGWVLEVVGVSRRRN